MIRRLIHLSIVGFMASGAHAFPTFAPKPASELAEFKVAEQAMTATIRATNPGVTGATGYLGFTVDVARSGELVVDAIQPDSPAQKAGIQKGDVVVRIGDVVVATPQAVREWIQASIPGTKLKVALVRKGKSMEVTAEVTATSRPLRPPTGPRPFLGLLLEERGEVIKVRSVTPDSPAAKVSLEAGDQVLKIDGDELSSPDKLRDILSIKRPGDTLTLLVVTAKDKKEKQLTVTLVPPQLGKDGPGGGRFGGRTGRGRGSFAALPPSLWTKPTLKAAVVPFEFADTKHNVKSTAEELEKLFFARAIAKQAGSSLNDYLHEASAGKLKLEGKVFSWVEVAKKRGDYVQGTGTSNRSAPLVEAINKLTSGDNKDALKDFEAIIFVYAGDRFARNRGAVFAPHAGTIVHQSRRLPYMLIPEGGSRLTTVANFAKEAGLMLGLPDLTARRENVGMEGLGPWCTMSAPDGNRTGSPPHPSPWCKEKLGWLKPVVIDPSVKQKLILSPIEGSTKECFKVLIRPDGSEYLLLENRRKTGFDSNLPGEGLLIWRVINDRPVLEESHGIDGPNGPNVHLSAVPYPSPSNNSFTPETTPSSRSPLGGGLPVHITKIKRHPDGRVSFQIGYVYE